MTATSQLSVILGGRTGTDRERRFAVLRENSRFGASLLAAVTLVMLAASIPSAVHAVGAVPGWESQQGSLLLIWEFIPLLLVAGSALGIYLVLHRRHRKKLERLEQNAKPTFTDNL